MKPKSIRLFSRAAMLLLMLLLTVTTTWADNVATVTANGNTITCSSLESAVSAATDAYTTYGTAATITLYQDITEQSCSLEVRKPMIITFFQSIMPTAKSSSKTVRLADEVKAVIMVMPFIIITAI